MGGQWYNIFMIILGSTLHVSLSFSPTSLTELCSFWCSLKDLFPLKLMMSQASGKRDVDSHERLRAVQRRTEAQLNCGQQHSATVPTLLRFRILQPNRLPRASGPCCKHLKITGTFFFGTTGYNAILEPPYRKSLLCNRAVGTDHWFFNQCLSSMQFLSLWYFLLNCIQERLCDSCKTCSKTKIGINKCFTIYEKLVTKLSTTQEDLIYVHRLS